MPHRLWTRYRTLNAYTGLFVGATYAQTTTYGIASSLAYAYLRRPKKDPWLIPSIVSLVWLLCSFCTAMDIYTSYYFITNIDNEALYFDPPWSMDILTAIVASTSTAVRLLYLYRIWRFHQQKGEWNVLLIIDIILVAAMSLLNISGGIAIAIILSLPGIHPNTTSLSNALEAAIVGAICADVLMVVTLCVSLYRARSGLQRTDSAITLFILYTICNGLLPACFSFATLVALFSRPYTPLYACFYIQVGNLFLIGLVSSLNHRKTIRSRIERDLDLNYDAFDSVGDTPNWIPDAAEPFSRSYGEVAESRSESVEASAAQGASRAEAMSSKGCTQGHVKEGQV